MEKILLVSLVGADNFGNRLQQFALQKTIEELGFETDIMNRRPLSALSTPRRIIKELPYRAIYTILRKKKYVSLSRRKKKFLEAKGIFYKNYRYVSVRNLYKTNWDNYKYVVVGSDQVWHSPSDYFFLRFVEESKRISYAPSFGFDVFPEDRTKEYHSALMGMQALSCREQSGCELIRGLTGREAQRVLDPTLLLTAADWAEIEKKPDFIVPAHYLLINMLGTIPTDYMAEIKCIADGNALQILNISDFEDPDHYAVSPDEFLWLVHHADTICTDSFHTAIFTIIFEKNLRVFKRRQARFNDMFGRLYNLLEPLGLLNTVYGDGDDMNTALSKRAKDYLAAEQEISLQYLKKSLVAE